MSDAGRPRGPEAAVDDGLAERLRERLRASAVEWPAEIEHLALVESTSDRLKQRARAGAAAWTVIIADAQTAGRGRQGRRWGSPVGNLYLSVLLRPAPADGRWSLLPLAAGLAVAEGLDAEGLEPSLKWPNDVMVGGRKIGGILAEAASSGGAVESVVIGIGVNVALRPADLPADVANAVTCAAEELGRAVDLVGVAASVLGRLTVWYHSLAREGPRAVLAAWRARAVPWWGRTVEATSGERRLRGIAEGLDEGGALILEMEDGTRAVLHSGDVREVRHARD